MGLLGGGNSELPSGYFAIQGLQTNGASYVTLGKGLINSEQSHDFSGYVTGGIIMGTSVSGYDYLWAGVGVLVWGGVICGISKYIDFTIDYESKSVTYQGKTYSNPTVNFTSEEETAIFGVGSGSTVKHISSAESKFYHWIISKNEKKLHEYIPVIDSSGVACVFDKVEKKTFYNGSSSQFIAILNSKQARKLGKLPDGGGTLKVSLPSNYLEDEGVTNAIAAANAKGWNIEVASTFEADGASATFALRRIWVRKDEDEHGGYVDADGKRYQVEWCVTMYTPDDSTPDMHGYELFRSVEAACEYWGLEPYVDPEQEELLTETTTNNE